jgi:hypothetical protein
MTRKDKRSTTFRVLTRKTVRIKFADQNGAATRAVDDDSPTRDDKEEQAERRNTLRKGPPRDG